MSIGGSLSGISFTGLASGIDSQSIVSQLIQIESFPIIRMQQEQIRLENRQSLFSQLRSLLVGFNSAASALNTAATFNPIKATSTDTDVATITATATAVAGTYNLTVSKLATTHKVSSNAHSSADTALSYSGTFVVDGRAVVVDASDTLTTIAGKINSSGADVTASIIDGGAGNAYLTITSKLSGGSNEVQLANLSGTALSSLGFQTGAASFRDQVDADSVRSYGFSDATTALSSLIGVSASGNFTIGTATLAIDYATDSLQDIADAINGDVNSNATAIVVEVEENGKKVQKLEITGNSGLPSITDTDGLLEAIGVYERAFTNELVAAQDAEYTLDGFSFTSAKNAITGVIPGSTLTLLKADVATPETSTLTLTKDVAKISSSMADLKDAYNGMIDFIRGATSFDTETFASGPLFGDPVVAQAESSLSSLMFTSVGNGTYTNLAQIGFSFDEDGKVALDAAALDQAISADPEAVRRLMMAVGDSTSNNLKFISSTSATQNSSGGYIVDITQVATFGNSVATVAQTGANVAGETLTFDGSLLISTPYNLIVPIGATQSDLVTLINADSKLKDLVLASVDGGGNLKIESKRYGAAGDFTVVSNLVAGPLNSGIGTAGGTYTAGLDVTGTIGGLAATGAGQFLTGDAGSDVEGLQVLYTGSSTGTAGTITFTRGVGAELTYRIDTFTDTVSGLLTTTDKSLQTQIDDMEQRISDAQELLELRRDFLNRKFLAMERAVARFQAQMAQLNAMTNLNR